MQEQVIYSRKIYNYWDLLGDVGGVMEVFQVLFGFLILPISYHLFIISATSKLYAAKTKDVNLFKNNG